MKIDRTPAFHTRRDAWVEINLAALEHNVDCLLKALPTGVSLMAVVKADAYGHSAPMVIPALESKGVVMLGVASIDEALQVKQTNTKLPVLVLGPTPLWALPEASKNGFAVTLYSLDQLDALEAHFERTQKITTIHIKVDTGMHRLGASPEDVLALLQACHNSPAVIVEGLFTHLADPLNPDHTQAQLTQWQRTLQQIDAAGLRPSYIHIASSSSVPLAANQGGNLARVGLALFGYGPEQASLGLKPAMQLKARISHLTTLQPGQGVSYGFSYTNTTAHPETIATLPIGYADGLPRALSNKATFIAQNQWCPQVGNICMDQCLVNVSALADPKVGDIITLMGTEKESDKAVWLNDWAKTLNTIEYELMCGLRIRLGRTFVR